MLFYQCVIVSTFMEDPRAGLVLTMVVVSILLRLNGIILIHARKGRIDLIPALLLDLLSPIMCMSVISFRYSRNAERDLKHPVKGSFILMGTLLLSQILTGMIFIGLLYLLDLPIPAGRALGPESSMSSFTAAHVFFIISFYSAILLLSLKLLFPEVRFMSLFRGRELMSTSVFVLLLLPVLLMISHLLSFFFQGMGSTHAPRMLPEMEGPGDILMMILALAVLAPLVEELLFRGFLYRILRSRYSSLPSIIITSILFSAVHFSLAMVVPIFIMGVLMAWARERSGSMAPSLLLHSINNLVAVLLLI